MLKLTTHSTFTRPQNMLNDIYLDDKYIGYWDIYFYSKSNSFKTDILYNKILISFNFAVRPDKNNLENQLNKLFLLK